MIAPLARSAVLLTGPESGAVPPPPGDEVRLLEDDSTERVTEDGTTTRDLEAA